ncbi:MAG: DUF4403 family protein [Flavobacteriales bacterium]
MKRRFHLCSLGFGLLLFACQTVNIPPPYKSYTSKEISDAPPSYISIPLSMDLTPYLKTVEKTVPTVFEGSKEQCEGLSISYGFNRSPIQFIGMNDRIDYTVEGGLWLKANYCPGCQYIFNKSGDCVIPRVYVSCGIKEPLRRFTLGYSSQLYLNSTYNLTSKTHVNYFNLDDPCSITFVGYDITQTVEREVRKELIKLEGTIDENIQKIDIKSYLSSAWNEMQKPIPIPSFGYLTLQPKALSVHSLAFKGNTFHCTTTMAISPSVFTDKKEIKTQALPPLTSLKSSDEFNLEVPINIGYDSLSSMLNQLVKGQEIKIKNKKIVIEKASIYGSQNDQLILEVTFGGFRHGTFYLIGKPVLFIERKELRLDSLNFELKTKSVLLQTAKWLFDTRISKMIQEKSHFSYASALDQAVKAMESGINSPLNESLTLQGQISNTEITSIQLKEAYASLFISLKGNLKLNIK